MICRRVTPVWRVAPAAPAAVGELPKPIQPDVLASYPFLAEPTGARALMAAVASAGAIGLCPAGATSVMQAQAYPRQASNQSAASKEGSGLRRQGRLCCTALVEIATYRPQDRRFVLYRDPAAVSPIRACMAPVESSPSPPAHAVLNSRAVTLCAIRASGPTPG